MYKQSHNQGDVSAIQPIAGSLFLPELSDADLMKKVTNIKTLAYGFLKLGKKSEATKLLNCLQEGSITEIDQDKPELDKYLASLILEQEIPEALEVLLKGIRTENRLTVISGKEEDYHALKQFIKRSLQMDYSKYQVNSETKRSILKQFIKIDPELIKIINKKISRISSSHSDKVDVNTLYAFKSDFDKLCNQYAQNSSLSLSADNLNLEYELPIAASASMQEPRSDNTSKDALLPWNNSPSGRDLDNPIQATQKNQEL